MTDDTLIQQLREMHYPGKVDVVDSVMEQVAKRPLLAPVPSRSHRWIRAVLTAAACALLAVGVNMVLLQNRQFDSKSIGTCLAEVYDYHSDYGYVSEYGAIPEDEYSGEEDYSEGYDIGVEELFY